MNANKQDAGGLPELPEPVGHVHSDYEYCAERPFKNDGWPVSVYEAQQVRAYGELCRAAPAGGDVEVVRLRQLLGGTQEQFRVVSELLERNQAHHERMMKLMDSAPAGGDARTVPFSDWMEAQHELGELRTMLARSAPAGSGEVEEMAKRLLVEASDVVENTCLHDVLMRAAALLRKLQQGAE